MQAIFVGAETVAEWMIGLELLSALGTVTVILLVVVIVGFMLSRALLLSARSKE